MAVVDFGGKLRIVQNFTANPDALTAAVKGVKYSSVDSNRPDASSSLGSVTVASTGLSSLSNAEADFGARTMLLSVRSLAKNLAHRARAQDARSLFRRFRGDGRK